MQIGDHFGQYRLDGVLGHGRTGVVHRAYDLAGDAFVALKLFHPDRADDPAFGLRFGNQCRLAATLTDPHVLPLLDWGIAAGQFFLAMTLVEGPDLGRVLGAGPLQPARAVDIVRQVADALDSAHRRGLLHRDVKPANILLTRDRTDDPDFARLADFGLSRTAGGGVAMVATGAPLGTVDYLSPEQVDGRPLDARSDVYALGCVLYHCLSGRSPFAGPDPAAILDGHRRAAPPPLPELGPIGPAFDRILATALAKDPGRRFWSAGELAAAAASALPQVAAVHRVRAAVAVGAPGPTAPRKPAPPVVLPPASGEQVPAPRVPAPRVTTPRVPAPRATTKPDRRRPSRWVVLLVAAAVMLVGGSVALGTRPQRHAVAAKLPSAAARGSGGSSPAGSGGSSPAGRSSVVLPAPTGLMASPSGAGFQLMWTAVPGAAHYVVVRDAVAVSTGVSGPAFLDTPPSAPTTHDYLVYAVDATGRRGRPAEVFAARAAAPVPAVTATPAAPVLSPAERKLAQRLPPALVARATCVGVPKLEHGDTVAAVRCAAATTSDATVRPDFVAAVQDRSTAALAHDLRAAFGHTTFTDAACSDPPSTRRWYERGAPIDQGTEYCWLVGHYAYFGWSYAPAGVWMEAGGGTDPGVLRSWFLHHEAGIAR